MEKILYTNDHATYLYKAERAGRADEGWDYLIACGGETSAIPLRIVSSPKEAGNPHHEVGMLRP